MSLSRGFVVQELGSGVDINWNPYNLFKKTVSGNTTFTFSNIEDKVIHVLLTNSTGSNLTVNFPTVVNNGDVVKNLRPNSTMIYIFGSADGDVFCLAPIRSEAVYA